MGHATKRSTSVINARAHGGRSCGAQESAQPTHLAPAHIQLVCLGRQNATQVCVFCVSLLQRRRHRFKVNLTTRYRAHGGQPVRTLIAVLKTIQPSTNAQNVPFGSGGSPTRPAPPEYEHPSCSGHTTTTSSSLQSE